MARKTLSTSRSSSKKPLLTVAIVVFALSLLVVSLEYMHITHFWHSKPAGTTTSGPTPEQQKQQSETFSQEKKKAIENPPTQSTPQPVDSANISITAQKNDPNSVTIFTKLSGVASGTCNLEVSNGPNVTSQTAQVIYQPEFSTCAGFSVPVNSIGTGTWTIRLTVSSNGTDATKTVTQDIQ